MNIFRAFKGFLQDVITEFRRVSWPTRQTTLQSTGVVLVLTLAVAVFLGVVDLGLSHAVKLIIR